MTRIAAIDIGTNSTKMTVAEVTSEKTLSVVSEASQTTRLGEGVDAQKSLKPEAMERTLQALREFKAAADAAQAQIVAIAGTSALRDASNGPEFLQRAQETVGHLVEIISGDREAALAFTAVHSDNSLSLPTDGSLLIFDIGGGSTELILGDTHGIGRHQSLQLGAVRVTERFLKSDPPTEAELTASVQFIDETLQGFLQNDRPVSIAGIGGTAVNLASVSLGLPKPDPDRVHGVTLTQIEIQRALERFESVPLEERKEIPGLEPKRADVIIGGALILNQLLTLCGVSQIIVSARGLRYGLLAEKAR